MGIENEMSVFADKLDAAREQALEEAATVAENKPMRFAGQTERTIRETLATAIRALKSQPAPELVRYDKSDICLAIENGYDALPSDDGEYVLYDQATAIIAAEQMKLEALEAKNKRLRDALAEYIEARDAYEAATKPTGGFGAYHHLNHADTILIRYREARAALGEVK